MSSYKPRTIFHRFHRACPGRSEQVSSYQTSHKSFHRFHRACPGRSEQMSSYQTSHNLSPLPPGLPRSEPTNEQLPDLKPLILHSGCSPSASSQSENMGGAGSRHLCSRRGKPGGKPEYLIANPTHRHPRSAMIQLPTATLPPFTASTGLAPIGANK
jgi:hypothetical protein